MTTSERTAEIEARWMSPTRDDIRWLLDENARLQSAREFIEAQRDLAAQKFMEMRSALDLAIAGQAEMRETLDAWPVLSKYHGRNGFELEKFIDDYQAWASCARQALSASSPRAEAMLKVVEALREFIRGGFVRHRDRLEMTIVHSERVEVLHAALAAYDAEQGEK